MNDLQKLFINEICDIYDAEHQLIDVLPKMAEEAHSEELRQAFQEHLEVTRGQVERRALPRPGRPEESCDLVLLDAQVEPAQRDRLSRTGAEDLEDVVQLERAEGDLVALGRLAVEASQRHRKLSIISRYASTLSTPTGVPRSTIASLPPCAR